MHPAPSVIIFTSLSGIGFGLLAWLGIGHPNTSGWIAFGFYFLGYALAVGGLMASVFHLGNPKNAVKAFRQWSTSWLSREGIIAVIALLVVAAHAFGRVFFGGSPALLGWIGAIMCVITVFTTSMIYAQLRTIPRWNHPLTPVLFVSLSLGGGALLAGQAIPAAILLVLAAAAQVAAWMLGDKRFAERGTTLETATGLGRIGKVRQFEPPHSGGNYLLHEMAYQVARKHADKLRVIGFALAFVIPLVLLMLPMGHLVAFLAVLIHLVGVFALRWLFFAEAKHVVSLYYGK